MIKPLVTKKGKNPGSEMCQLWVELPITSAEDDGMIEDSGEESSSRDETVQIVAFPDAYKRVKDDLEVGTPVLVGIERLRDGLGLRSLFRLDKLKTNS